MGHQRRHWRRHRVVLPRSGEYADVFESKDGRNKIYLVKGHPNLIEPFTRKGWYIDWRKVYKGDETNIGWNRFDRKVSALSVIKRSMKG